MKSRSQASHFFSLVEYQEKKNLAVGVIILARKGASLLTLQLAKKSRENLLRRFGHRNFVRRPEERARDVRERNSNEEENAPDNIPGSNVYFTSSGSGMTFAYCGEEEGEETKKND